MEDNYVILLNILDEEINIYRNILDIISSEYQAFVARDYENIDKHIKLKESFYEKVILFESRRSECIEKIQATITGVKIENLSDLISNVNEPSLHEAFSLRRTTLRLLVDRIAEANDKNRLFINQSRTVFNSVMDNYKKLATANRINVYGNKGKLDESRDTQNPILLNKEV